ncbi:UNVERIFIED_CONTAM: hypothetical protein HDU68_003140 [Siphonaria sp. JEL0065]|nr:hypothetical protein HDU68_003140 [Siphonaria sp. JEL0065]
MFRPTTLRSLTSLAPTRSFVRSSLFAKPVSLAVPSRGLLRRTSDPIKNWSVPNVQQTVLQLLFEYSQGVAPSKVNLDSSIQNVLLVDRQDRFGLQWELCEIFQIYIDTARYTLCMYDMNNHFGFKELEVKWTVVHNRDFASGREAAEWIAAVLEEQDRLEF